LRSPLRGIDGYSQALLEDYAEQLPEEGQHYLQRIRSSAQRMATLIDDLLKLAQVTRAQINFMQVDLSKLAGDILSELRRTHSERRVKSMIAPNLLAQGDPRLLGVVLENLLNNAWKYTSKQERAQIEFGKKQEGDETIYFIRDNGAGFDMAYADKLFGAFQRLHTVSEFPGTGIGLATVQRILQRHGGRIWAEGAVNEGATFFFTVPTLSTPPVKIEPKEEASLLKRAKEII
jgi:light-regulated signal transduction histidine kinase (bacteriophytochrome)